MLLIVSQRGDLHTDRVAAFCRRRGVEFALLYTHEFPQDVLVALEVGSGGLGGTILLHGREIALEQIRAVWYRRPAPVEPCRELDPAYAAFVRQEAQATLSGLYRALWDRRWVNPPHSDAAASYKLHQLSLARRLGFDVPRSIVTNDPDEAQDFFQSCGREMIYKLMFPLFVDDSDGEPLGVYTTRISAEDFEQHIGAVRAAPCLFQALVPKQYELRINVIGRRVWAAAIYSQDREETLLDYRHNTEGCRHAPAVLPPTLEAQCIDITRRLGLRMSNIDMIVTPDGRYVFLEVNPNGQWAWVEEYVGFPLTAALIDELLGMKQ